jgi:hypothetical protein
MAVLIAILVTLPAITSLFAQQRPKTTVEAVERRAILTGGGSNSGKCTIEVSVDDQVEVEVADIKANLRTLTGQPATWIRFECTTPLPHNMGDFELRPISGRGKVTLVQDPRPNSGRAIVRIEDPRIGRDDYTFELLWRGATSFDGLASPDPREYGHTDRQRAAERDISGGMELNFAGRGDGFFRRHNGNDRLTDLDLSIRGHDVRITLKTAAGASIYFTGQVVEVEKAGNRITAQVSSDLAAGTMYIESDRQKKVRSLSMSQANNGLGRNLFDLRWHN